MDTRFRFTLILLGVLLVLYAVAEAYRPQETSWAHTYQNNERTPFGTYALVELLPGLFGTPDVTVTREPVFNQINDKARPTFFSEATGAGRPLETVEVETDTISTDDDASDDPSTNSDEASQQESPPENPIIPTETPINYLLVAPTVRLDSLDLRALLNFAAAGHHVFLAADDLPERLADSLGLVVRPYDAPYVPNRDSVRLLFAGDSTGRAYRFARGDISGHFRQKGLTLNPALTTLAADAAGRAVLVRARRGLGDITLCSVPTAFTNYFVLRQATAGFAWQALSGLPRGPVWWDEYAKQGRAGSDSLLRVVMAHPALRIAFWLLLAGGLLLLWVGGRRRQRIIPVVAPLPNNTLQFVRTVAGLYQQGDNHQAIAHRKIDLFLDHLRTRYREPTDDLTAEPFRAALAQKTGLPRSDVNELLRRLAGIRASDYVSDGDLLWLSQALSEVRRR